MQQGCNGDAGCSLRPVGCSCFGIGWYGAPGSSRHGWHGATGRRRGVMPVCVMWLLAALLSPEVPSNAALAN